MSKLLAKAFSNLRELETECSPFSFVKKTEGEVCGGWGWYCLILAAKPQKKKKKDQRNPPLAQYVTRRACNRGERPKKILMRKIDMKKKKANLCLVHNRSEGVKNGLVHHQMVHSGPRSILEQR